MKHTDAEHSYEESHEIRCLDPATGEALMSRHSRRGSSRLKRTEDEGGAGARYAWDRALWGAVCKFVARLF